MSTETSGASITEQLKLAKPFIGSLPFRELNEIINDKRNSEVIDGKICNLKIYLGGVVAPGGISLADSVRIIPLDSQVLKPEEEILTIETVSMILQRREDGGTHLHPYLMYVAYRRAAEPDSFDSVGCRIEAFENDEVCTKRFESIPDFWKKFWDGLQRWAEESIKNENELLGRLRRFESICNTEGGKVMVNEHLKNNPPPVAAA